MVLLSAVGCDFLTDPSKKRARFPAPLSDFGIGSSCLAAARDDVAAGAALVVEHADRLGVLDAVAGAVGGLDRDVLDAGVIRGLELRERRSDVAGLRVVGRERLDARNRRADVGLGGR